ncbi:putative mannitol dehydrogenase-like, partial [Trifolium medium]|nr:putative mannitol dehydrogenase-like [Trifolium medium]
AATGTIDYIIDTISADHSVLPLLGLLKLNGKLVTVGLPSKPLELPVFPTEAYRGEQLRRDQGDSGDARFLRKA